MTLSEILEALMLAAFSIGWYWSISVMLWTRLPYGKSGAFICCTIVGYGMGLIAQVLEWQSGEAFSYLVFLYGWNLFVTAVDLALVVYFRRMSVMPLQDRPIIFEVLPAPGAHYVDPFPDGTHSDQGTSCSPSK